MEDRLGRALSEIEIIQLKMALTLEPIDTQLDSVRYWEKLLEVRPNTFSKTGIIRELNSETIRKLSLELQRQTRISIRTDDF